MLELVLRTGDLHPAYTLAIADQFHVLVSGDLTVGYRVDIRGTDTVRNWSPSDGSPCQLNDCGDAGTRASEAVRTFSGNTQNMASWDPTERATFIGAYVATNAEVVSPVLVGQTFPVPGWYLSLANPHLDVNGQPATGSFTAWVPPNYFASIHTTAVDAVDAGFEITRTDGTVETLLTGTAVVDNDGGYFRIESLGYSTPRITVRQRQAAAPDAGSGPPDAGPGGTNPPGNGCGCNQSGEAAAVSALLLAALAFRSRARPAR